MKPYGFVLLGLCVALGPCFSAEPQRPVLEQEFKPEGARPGFWWTRRVNEYTLQFFGEKADLRLHARLLNPPPPSPPQAQGVRPGTATPLGRSSFFIGNTIANLRGLDPTFGCRTLTLIDGRRANPSGTGSPTREPSPSPAAQAAASPTLPNVEMQVWLLSADGTIVMPQRKSEPTGKYCDTGIVYGFEYAAARDAVAAAFSDGEHDYVQKLQPFADEQD